MPVQETRLIECEFFSFSGSFQNKVWWSWFLICRSGRL